jgi:pyruvate,water dikinase
VARELGIPAVVGVEDACRWLKDGDWVELDGASGTIRKLEHHERAA